MPDSISFRLITILPFISHGYIIQSRSRMHKMSLAVSSISRGYGQNLFSAKTHSVCVSVCVPYNKNRTFRLGFFSASIVLTGTAERGGPTAEQKKNGGVVEKKRGGGGGADKLASVCTALDCPAFSFWAILDLYTTATHTTTTFLASWCLLCCYVLLDKKKKN